ncbi:cation transporter [Paenisporosarcina antarctica]|uniref:Cation transporter n=2 Tax=Paenisporosarcina antarctica TaxID=417367 RepID=A0A4P7A2J4_9BACL|nr:cation transporter [Paenisporosarcina antarctica]
MVLEFFGGLFTNSLALLSDSGHMLSDASSLALSLVALWFANRPPSPSKTYGYYRFEILAALFNGITLFLISGFIIYEAIQRFNEPPSVSSGTMILIACIGLIANALSAFSLLKKADVKGNINMKSAYVHIIGDALGSVGAIVAGIFMLAFDWYIADPIISVLVALLILKSAWGVLKQSIHILMEGTPSTLDKDETLQLLKDIDGVLDVHDLHIWTITSGMDSLSCHIVINENEDEQVILQRAIHLVLDRYKIEHTTIQIEKPNLIHPELHI